MIYNLDILESILSSRDENEPFVKPMKDLIKQLRAAREVVSYAASLMSEEDARNAMSHFNVLFGLKDAVEKYEAVCGDEK